MDVTVSQEISPIKFCFFFIPGDEKGFEKCVRSSNSLWGGTSNPIFPLFRRFSKLARQKWQISNSVNEFYGNLLINHDVDVVIYQDGLDEHHVKDVSQDLKLIPLSKFKEELQRAQPSYGMSSIMLMMEVIGQEFKYQRQDNLSLLLPEPPQDVYEIVLHCIPDEKIHETLSDFAKVHSFIKRIASTEKIYLENEKTRDFKLVEILNFKVVRSSVEHLNSWLFVFNRAELDDVVALWNLWTTGQDVIPIDKTVYFDGRYDASIVRLYGSNSRHPITLKAPSIKINELRLFSRYLRNILATYHFVIHPWLQDWFPRFGESMDIMKADGVLVRRKTHKHDFNTYQVKDEYLSFPSIQHEIESIKNSWGKVFRNTIKVQYYDSVKEYASTVVDISKKQWAKIVDSYQVNEFRVGDGALIKLCRSGEINISFKPPKVFPYLKEFFANHEIQIEVNPGANLSHQIFKNLNGKHGLYMIDSVGAVNVLQKLEGGKPMHYQDLLSTIQRHKPRQFEENPRDYISGLIEHNMVEFGCQIKCSICGQNSFYAINVLETAVICKQCSSTFKPPLNNPRDTFKWSYRGLGPFSKNNKVDGMIPGFLTLRLIDFKFSSSESSTTLMNFDIKHKNRKLEIDLFVQLRTENFGISSVETIFCECKNFKRIEERDIERLKYVGELFPGSILVFSTLNDSLIQAEIDLLTDLTNHFRLGMGSHPRNPVLILTSNELLPEDLYTPFNNTSHESEENMYSRDIKVRCDQSVVHYLHLEPWSRVSGQRWVEYHGSLELIRQEDTNQ